MTKTLTVNAPAIVSEIIDLFEMSNYEIFVVGGAVRDCMIGKHTDDWDFTTNAPPTEALEILPENAFYDNAFGTVMLPVDDLPSPIDITTYRTEHGYKDNRRPDKVIWGNTLEEDLKRRDFTINAMAFKSEGERHKNGDIEFSIIDPFDGQGDLEKKLIRAVGDPNERFAEDALRMMRAVRIASELNFKIESETLEAIKSNSERIHNIAKERVKTELFKTLASPFAHSGMEMLRESGLMQEILPELEKTFGVDQKSPGRHHIHDVGTHCMLSLKYCQSTDPLLRFACLIHDIGKPQTYKKLKSGVVTFYNHEVVGARIAKQIADRLRFSNKEKDRLWTLVRYHQFTVDENQTDKAIRRFIRKVGLENVDDMLTLRTADRLGSGSRETSWRTEEFKQRIVDVQKQPFSVRDLKIKGEDVMRELDIQPGPGVGEILNQLFKLVDDEKVPNEKELLLKELKKIGKKV